MNKVRMLLKRFKEWRFARLVARCEKRRHQLTPIQAGNKWGKGCTRCKYYLPLDRKEFRRVFKVSPLKFKKEFEKRHGEKFLNIS